MAAALEVFVVPFSSILTASKSLVGWNRRLRHYLTLRNVQRIPLGLDTQFAQHLLGRLELFHVQFGYPASESSIKTLLDPVWKGKAQCPGGWVVLAV